jgi:hypothetical protein
LFTDYLLYFYSSWIKLMCVFISSWITTLAYLCQRQIKILPDSFLSWRWISNLEKQNNEKINNSIGNNIYISIKTLSELKTYTSTKFIRTTNSNECGEINHPWMMMMMFFVCMDKFPYEWFSYSSFDLLTTLNIITF